jgi:integrase/recombinase XerD
MSRRGTRKPRPVVGDPTDPQGFAVLVARYLEWMRVKGYAERSVGDREHRLAAFIRWCEERSIARPAEVTRPMLERYARTLYHHRKADGRPLSFNTQMYHLVAVRALFKWLARQSLILYNPASELDLPKVMHGLPKQGLTAGEADQILSQPNLEESLGIRDRAILETFYSTGIRRSELLGLNLYDLDVERGVLMVRKGKGGKDRVIPIGERAMAWLDKYLVEVRPRLVVPPDEKILFLTNDGHQITPDRLSRMARRYVEKAGIGKKGACHLFRHTMATLMLEGGADIRFIQQMLGHAKLETTQIYTQVSISKLKEIHTATHPGARLRRRAGTRGEERGQATKKEKLSISGLSIVLDEDGET